MRLPPVSLRPSGFLLALTLVACSSDISQPSFSPKSSSPESSGVRSNVSVVSTELSDGRGTAWRQLTETVGLTWGQVAQLCPRDGINPCTANAGLTNLTGWVWATDEQVVQLLSRYAPDILNNRLLSGAQYGAAITAFFTDFQPTTTGGCSGSGYVVTCSFGAHASGWTATSYGAGSAISGTIQSGFGGVPLIQVATDANIALSSPVRGMFMWRADGSGGTAIVANDDVGSVASPYAGVVVQNVLANDLLAGGPANVGNVVLAQLSTTSPKLSLNTADASVSIAYGTRVGSESLRYRICERARPANCASATVSVTISGNRVDANDDVGASKTGGGTGIANVLSNDTFNGAPASLTNVSMSATSSDAALMLQPSGALRVSAGASVGTHSITYEICEVGNPSNCDQATASVSVTPFAIDAVDDYGSAPSAPGGRAVGTVLVNDLFDNVAATLATVTLSTVSSSSAGVTLDVSTGAVRVAPGTQAGTQSLVYRMCETASPSNCDQATVTVTIVPQGYVVSNDRIRVNEGSSGSFTVKMLQPPSANVTVNVSYLAGTMSVTSSVATLNFTPANWNTAQTVSFSTVRDSDKDDNAGTLQLVASGIAVRDVVISGLDTDRKTSLPTATLQAPYNGQTVSGMVNIWGTATSSGGALVDGKFYIDSNRIATVANAAGTFRAPLWNSATVTNGWHTLELRVADATNNDGRNVIKVFVSN